MVYTATAPTNQVAPIAQTPDATATLIEKLDNTFEAALEHARRLTEMFGTSNPEVAIAWETVEELQSARIRSIQLQTATPKAAFLRYCEENPDALEARLYDD